MASSNNTGTTRSRGRAGAREELTDSGSADVSKQNGGDQNKKISDDICLKVSNGKKEKSKEMDSKRNSRSSSPAQSSGAMSGKEPHTPDQGRRSGKADDEDSSKEESPSGSSTKSSPPVEPLLANRPKRQVVPKNLDVASGLSWKEENDLKKALYASLQESRKWSRQQSDESGIEQDKDLLLTAADMKARLHKVADLRHKDESSQDSFKSALLGEDSNQDGKNLFRGRVHAQRKFAQGSRPCSPCTTPVKVKPSPKKLFTGKSAKTEDFLTFLCLRGSHVLSPNLDFFSSANNGNENGTEPPSSPPQHECVVPESPGIKSALVNGTAPVSPAPSRDSSHDDNELNQALDLGVAPLVTNQSDCSTARQWLPTAAGVKRTSSSSSATAHVDNNHSTLVAPPRGNTSCVNSSDHVAPTVTVIGNTRFKVVPLAPAIVDDAPWVAPPSVHSANHRAMVAEWCRSGTFFPAPSGAPATMGSRSLYPLPPILMAPGFFQPKDDNSPKKISSKPDASVVTKPIVTVATKPQTLSLSPEKSQRASRSSQSVLLPGLSLISMKPKSPTSEVPVIPLKRVKQLNGRHATRATASNQHRDSSPSKDIRSKVRLKDKKSGITMKKSLEREAGIKIQKKVSELLKKRTKKLKDRKNKELKRSALNKVKMKTRSKEHSSGKKKTEIMPRTTRSQAAKREHEPDSGDHQQSSPPKIKKLASSEFYKSKKSSVSKSKHEMRETRQSSVTNTSPLSAKSVSKKSSEVERKHIPAGAVKKSASHVPKSASEVIKALKNKSSKVAQPGMSQMNTRHKPTPLVKLLFSPTFSTKKRPNKPKKPANSHTKTSSSSQCAKDSESDKVPRVPADGAAVESSAEASISKSSQAENGSERHTSLSSPGKQRKHNTAFDSQSKKRGRPTGNMKSKGSSASLHKQPFPSASDPAGIVECPVYHPSPEQFQDPMAYIASVRSEAERYGMCRVVPPPEWKPECRVQEELRFSSQIQHIHKMHNRWGPNVQQMECLRTHLDSQGIKLDHPPTIGGVEVDLPRFYQTVQSLGGMQTVIDRKKWLKIADILNIPKTAQERFGKLYDAYCKYLLSYDLLSAEEKERLERQVIAEHEKQRGSGDDCQHCVYKGKSVSLSMFFRTARNIMSMWLKDPEPAADQVEAEFWKIISQRTKHVAVQAGHIDTKNIGGGFPTKKDSPYSRHGWNFNMLSSNSNSLLKYLGAPISGVNLPMLHVGMLFSTSCLACDRHFLPYLQYMHSGADIVWYAVPSSQVPKLKTAMQELVPDLLNETPVWLPEDSILVPPPLLMEKGVSLSRCVQKQGEFVVVFSEVYTTTISSGYNLSESLHVAPPSWLSQGYSAAKLLYDSCEPELFSVDRLICTLARSDKTPVEILENVLPHLQDLVNNELDLRKQVMEAGLKNMEEMSMIDDMLSSPASKRRKNQESTEETGNVCEITKKICYLSMIVNETDDTVLSLQQAIRHLQKKKNLKPYKFMYRFDEKALKDMVSKVKQKIQDHTESPKRSGKTKT